MIAAVGVCAILVIAGIGAALRGPWLDEFWTLELSDASRGLPALIRDGWMRDAHPPVFNAWATLLASLGITSIPAGRLVSNLLAAGLMILAAFRLSRRTPGQAGFAAALLLLTLSLPQAMESFTHYRSYFWQMTAIGTLALVARHVAATKADLDWRRDLDLAAIAVLATAASIGLHYVGALFGGLLASAIAVCAFARGLRRWAALMLATTVLSSLFVLASVAVQAPNWAVEFDHTWIDLPGLAALGVLVSLAVAPLWLNPVSLAGLWWRRGQGTRDPSQIWFFAMIGAVLVVGTAIVLVAHAVQPIVVDRYLFAVPVLVSALLAVPAARLARDRWLFGLLVLVAVVGRGSADDRDRRSGRCGARMPAPSPPSSPAARRPRSTPPAAGRWDRPPRRARRGERIRSSSAPTARSRSPGAIPSTSSANSGARTAARTRRRAPVRCCSGTSTPLTRPRTTCRGPSRPPASPGWRGPACRSRAAPRGSCCAPTGPQATRSQACRRSARRPSSSRRRRDGEGLRCESDRRVRAADGDAQVKGEPSIHLGPTVFLLLAPNVSNG